MKHTPGPWHVSLFGSFWTRIRSGDPKTGMVVAATCTQSSTARSYEANLRRAQQNEANARLIAAAPELLQSCIDLLAIVRVQNGNLHDDINAVQTVALAAIEKAEGRTL